MERKERIKDKHPDLLPDFFSQITPFFTIPRFPETSFNFGWYLKLLSLILAFYRQKNVANIVKLQAKKWVIFV